MKYSVAVERCIDYEPETVRRAIEKALKPLGGIGAYVEEDERILIKLNLLSSKSPDHAVTTHPSFVKEVIELVRECGGIPLVGDSPGGRNTPSNYRALLKKTGIMQVIDETGAEAVYFDTPKQVVDAVNPSVYKKFTVTGVLSGVDKVVCLPKLKTHQLTGYTGAVKLLYGYIPGVMKSEYHLFTGSDIDLFANLLLDLHETFPPNLSIMDAVVGMEGNGGPHVGTPKHIGLCIASDNCPALDQVAASILGYEPMNLPTIRKAVEREIGPASLDEIEVFGIPIQDALVSDFDRAEVLDLSGVPPTIKHIVRKMFAPRPVIDHSLCVKCGTCAEDCPPGAITFSKGSFPSISQRNCIRCYCCQELCPAGAVGVKIPALRKLLG